MEKAARSLAIGAAPLAGRFFVAVLAAGALSACGGTAAVVVPPAHSVAERQWLANARQLIATLDSDVLLSAAGGANLATARRALGDQSDVYTMVVAYTLFGDCTHALANVGTPGAREAEVSATLITACRRLERASGLFEQAMSRRDARRLLAATRAVLETAPILDRAKTQLTALHP